MEEEERRGGRLGLTVDMTTGVLLVEMTALSREEQTSNKLFKKKTLDKERMLRERLQTKRR